jgi:tetratricopeptide (TPR) repeat protein
VKKGVREIERRLLQPAGDAERLGALLDMGTLHAELGHERDGLRAAREALDLARDGADRLAGARALALAARCHFQRGDHFAAIASGVDALDAFAAEEPQARAAVLRIVALALRAVEDLEHAEAAATAAVRLATGEPALEAAARETCGRVLAERGRNHEARQQLRRAGALFRHLFDRTGLKRITAEVAASYRNQANAAHRAGRTEQARLQWRHAARVYRTALAFGRHPAHDAATLAALAECELGLGDLDGAYEHAGLAAALAQDAEARATLARARLCESQALQAMSRIQAAERACSHAVTAADTSGEERLLITALRAHARLQDLLGRFQTGADLDERARRLEQQRATLLGDMRAQLAPLLDRTRRDPRLDSGA